MVLSKLALPATALIAASLTSGCATAVPELHRAGETQQNEIARQAKLVGHIKCELKHALHKIQQEEEVNEGSTGQTAAWLDKWGTKVSLMLQVEDSTAFSPNITYLDPRRNIISTFAKGGNVTTAQSFSATLAFVGSSKATRTERISFFFNFADLKAEDAGLTWEQKVATPCAASEATNMEGDLKIYDFMRSKVQLTRLPSLLPRAGGESPFEAFNYEVQFVVTRSGSATPTWKLLPVSFNPASTALFNGSRTRTNNMLLTLARAPDKQLDKNGQDAHAAALFGQAVTTAIQGQSR